MVLIAVNASLRRNRRRLGLVLATFALGLAVTAAHGAMGGGHMAGMSMAGEPTDVVVTMCLAIVETAALTLGAVALSSALRCRHALPHLLAWPVGPELASVASAPVPRGRPPDLSVLQVFRR